jgi:hypothetical protein
MFQEKVMQKKLMLFIVLVLMVSLGACSSISRMTSSEVTNDKTTLNNEQTVDSSPVQSVTESSGSAATPVEVNEDPEDYEWDIADEISISLADNAINFESSDVTVNGSVLTIEAAGTYRISGSLSDGEIIVNTKDDGVVRLILDGVDIQNTTGPAIFVEDADKVVVYLPAGSQNYLSDGESYTLPDPESDEPNAALFSTADLIIDGAGSLMVTALYNDAIASKDGLIINNGNITLISDDDGLRGKDYVVIRSAMITIDASGDGIKSDESEDASKGYIVIESGTLDIRAGMDAIDAETTITIDSGTFPIVAGSGVQRGMVLNSSMKGIKGGSSISINNGNFTITSSDDSIHSNSTIVINDGQFTLSSGDDGIHADDTLTIENGQITILDSYEGLESATMNINNGEITIYADDDGINLAGGADGSGMNAGMGGGRPGRNAGPGIDAFGGAGNYALYINGGIIFVNANGDGIDSNGSITITDGTVVVNGPTENMNGALDYMGNFTISGGLLIAVGSSGMAQAPGTNSSQPSLMIFFGGTVAAGTPVNIQNSAGENILTFVPIKQIQSLAF